MSELLRTRYTYTPCVYWSMLKYTLDHLKTDGPEFLRNFYSTSRAQEMFLVVIVEGSATIKNHVVRKSVDGKFLSYGDFSFFRYHRLETVISYWEAWLTTKSCSLFSLRSKLYNDTTHDIREYQ